MERIDKAYKRFFKKQGRPPRFKKVALYQSFTFKGKTGYKIQDSIISFNGYAFKFVKTYDLVGKPKTLTIKRDNLGDYVLCLVCEKEKTPKPAGANSVGSKPSACWVKNFSHLLEWHTDTIAFIFL